MRRLLATLVIALVGLVGAAPVAAQDGPVNEIEVISTRTRDSGLVELTIAVPGALAGRELPPSAVAVVVDGLQKPLRLEPLPNDDLEIVLAIDISGSMEGAPLLAAQEAAASFIRVLPPTAQVAVVAFDDEAFVAAPMGTGADEAVDAVEALVVDGDTAVYDALDLSLDQFGEERGTRRTVVLLTDGKDTASATTLGAVGDEVTRTRADVYAVALLTDQTDLAALEALAAPTKGRVVTTADTESLTALYDNIAAVLGSQYRVIFDPLTDEGGTAGIFLNYLGVGAQAVFEFEAAPAAAAVVRPEEASPDAAAQVSTPIRTSVVEPSWVSGDRARLLGVGLLAAALVVIGLLLFLPGSSAVRLATNTRDRVSNAGPGLDSARERATDFTERMLERNDRGRTVGSALERAGIELRPAEFVLLTLGVAVAGAMIGFLLGGLFLAALLFGLVVLAFRLSVSYLAARRSRQFEEQLPSTLQLMAGALRAGYALPQAAETVAAEAPSPTSDEFHRLVTEHRLGRDFGESLNDMAERIGSDDFRWVVQAIGIHREVGGDLAEVLDNVNGTIRDRNFIRRQFAALSAEGRYSAYLIVSLPFLVYFAMTAINPEYTDVFLSEPRGRMILLIAGLCIVVGSIWMKRLIRVRY